MKQKQNTCWTSMLLGLLLGVAPAVVQAQFHYTTNADNTITITLYTGAGGAVSVPAAINALPVTGIGTSAFYYVPSLTSITIPGSVTSIGEAAFEDCVGLTSVTIPASITNIGDEVFYECERLTNVTIPEDACSIGEYAFALCGLTSVTIPGNVTNIGSGAFSRCYSLTNVTIPDSVTSLGEYAFNYCTLLTSVTIPASVTNIEQGEFYLCTNLTNVLMPNSVTSIGEYAFLGCFSLTNLTIPDGVTSIGTDAFSECNNLTSLFFSGNAPAFGSPLFYEDNPTVYYLPGTTGWSNTFAGAPSVLWNPQMQAGGAGFGVSNNQFGFNITGTSNIPIVVEACTNLANPVWTSLQSLTLTNGLFYFSEPWQTNSSGRFYRISSP